MMFPLLFIFITVPCSLGGVPPATSIPRPIPRPIPQQNVEVPDYYLTHTDLAVMPYLTSIYAEIVPGNDKVTQLLQHCMKGMRIADDGLLYQQDAATLAYLCKDFVDTIEKWGGDDYWQQNQELKKLVNDLRTAASSETSSILGPRILDLSEWIPGWNMFAQTINFMSTAEIAMTDETTTDRVRLKKLIWATMLNGIIYLEQALGKLGIRSEGKFQTALLSNDLVTIKESARFQIRLTNDILKKMFDGIGLSRRDLQYDRQQLGDMSHTAGEHGVAPEISHPENPGNK